MADQRRVALIFAVDEYDHPDLQHLSAPLADADALAETLGSPELGGFSVEICHNATSGATAERLEDFLSERRPGDLALLHFSGHGLKDESGSLYLAARNTIPTRLASTAVDTTLINLLMRRSRARSIVLFLDCCYGGAFERGMTARAAGNVAVREQFSEEPLGGGRGRAVITASSAVQYAFEGTRLTDEQGVIAPSLFTGAVVTGIRSGEADRDGDGYISLAELYEHVYEKVLEQSPHQTPSKWEYGLEGELIISKSPRRPVRPAQLPDQLVEVIHHTYPVARRGAIEELVRLATGTDLPIAVAAVAALREMEDDDSRSIAGAATTAVESLTITVDMPELAFGEVELASVPPVLSCELSGPPLVESAEITVSPSHFTAQLSGRTIRVTMATASSAELVGALQVSSVIGKVTIPITGVVRDAPPVPASPIPIPLASAPAPAQAMREPISVPEPKPAPELPESTAALTAPSVDVPPQVRQLGPLLIAAAGVVAGVSVFVPWVSGVFGENSLWVDTPIPGVVLLLPGMFTILSAAVLTQRRDNPVALGVVFGAAAGGLLAVIETAVYAASIEHATLLGGITVPILGFALAIVGGSLCVRSSSTLWVPVAIKNDGWTFLGAGVIVAAFITAVGVSNSYGDAVISWMWVYPILLALMAIPVPFCRFTLNQRVLALSTPTTLVVLWTASTVANLSVGTYADIADAYWWAICGCAIAMVAGSALGQLPNGSRQATPATAAGQS